MPSSTDILLLLDEQSIVRQIEYSEALSNDFSASIKEEIHQWRGIPIAEIPLAEWDWENRVLHWKEYYFQFDLFQLNPSIQILLLYRENLREQMMEAALNSLVKGVQLFDADANILFLNQASARSLDVPGGQCLEGKNLREVFCPDEEYSTNLTAMRTRAPVYNRYDAYKSTTGKKLNTINTAYPVVKNGRLLGSISFEQDIGMLNKLMSEIHNTRQILMHHLALPVGGIKETDYTLQDLVGSSPKLMEAIELAARMALKDCNILIQGETGTGKEIFAQGIHALSSRRNGKFVAVNCAAFPESLVEGMLFGTVRGAFTGSFDKVGLIEAANHGTLFLDELNSMSPGMQAKLLRVLQENKIQRVGSTKNIDVDVRVISSCNENAFALSEDGKLRKDLFYRLASVIVEIPPLRERMEDLEELTWYCIRRNQDNAAQPIAAVAPEFWQMLYHHNWPGNVRELFHILNYAISTCENGTLQCKDFPSYFRTRSPAEPVYRPVLQALQPDERGLSAMVQAYERYILQEAYKSCGRNVTKMAEMLKLGRQNCQYYIKKYALNKTDE